MLKAKMASGHDISKWLTAESLTDDDRKFGHGNLLMVIRIESTRYPNLTEYYDPCNWALRQFFVHKCLGIAGTENIGLLDYARKKREELF